ncbi:MAG: YIP1 family protein [Gemmatimonadota bacterium]
MEYLESVPRSRSSFLQRLIGAATFRVSVYEEVEHDNTATGQAAAVVGLVAVAAAIGGAAGGIAAAVAGVAAAYIGWALWSGTCYLIGVQLFDGKADWGELLRTIGFAQAPGVLLLFGFLLMPGAGELLKLGVYMWMVGTVLVAIRQALDFSTGRALATALAGFVPYWLAKALVEFVLRLKPTVLPF